MGQIPSKIGLLDSLEASINPATEDSLAKLIGFEIPAYTEIDLSYTGDNLTGVVYKSGATTVATLTLSYTGAVLDSIVKT